MKLDNLARVIYNRLPLSTWQILKKVFHHSVLVSILAFLGPFVVYWNTMAPDLTWAYQSRDGGDLITAAYTLGIPHPSGYPTYTLVGWLFSRLLLGIKPIAWRFNLLSALSMAASAWLIFNILIQLTRSRLAALGASWTFAFIPLIWSQALVAEVYALNTALNLSLLYLALRVRAGWIKGAFWGGLVLGLTLGTHLTTVFILPLLGYCLIKYIPTGLKSGGMGLLLGLLVFLYLPLRSGQGAITWGAPHTGSGFWALVSGQLYQGYLFSLPFAQLGPRLLALWQYFASFGLVGLSFLGFGIRWTFLNRPQALFWSALSILLYSLYALGYNTADSYVYLITPFALLSIGLGLGIQDLLRTTLSRSIDFGIALLIFGAIGFMVFSNKATLDLSQDNQVQRFWQTVLAQTPPGAVLITVEEKQTFALWYAQYVLDQRPDLAIVDTRLLNYPWYQNDLRRHYPWLTQIDELHKIIQTEGAYPHPLCKINEIGEVNKNNKINEIQREYQLSKLQTGQQNSTWQVTCLNASHN